MRILLLFALLGLFVSCKSTQETVVTQEDVKVLATQTKDLVLSLDKGACFGTCPVYKLNIYNNRYVEFLGRQHVDKVGTYAKVLDMKNYKALIAAFDEAGFYTFQNHYESNIADLPQINISYNKEGMKKTVSGKSERPESIHRLQFKLEQIAESPNGWTFLSDEISRKKEVVNKSRIIIDIAKGNQLARWFSKMKEKFGMQILQKLSDNSDTWLVGINPKLHDPELILKYLLLDSHVKSARFLVETVEN